MSRRMHFLRLNCTMTAVAAACLAAVAATARAEESPADSASPAAAPSEALSGQVVVRDAETGELRAPTAEEAAELAKLGALERAGRPALRLATPSIQVAADGTKSMLLGEEHLNFEVVHIGPDGKLSFECAHGAHSAGQLVKSPPQPLETE